MNGKTTQADTLLVLCRPGFENDCAAEMTRRAAETGQGGYARARDNAGFLTWHMPGTSVLPLWQAARIFPRTAWPVLAPFRDLPQTDRISPLLALAREIGPVGAVRLEYPDTNEGRGLQRFVRGFRKAFEQALKKQGLLTPGQGERILQVFFEQSGQGFLGWGEPAHSGPWEQGIPRLRLPSEAPSRSALKIEEAWLRLMTAQERAHWLAAGRTAVDLGAAPGGWTWQLARHGVRVTAVDHGRLVPALLADFPVSHVAGDAFTWRPPRPQDWLVCDVVDKPARTLSLMEKWLVNGWAKVALFNLKLPMKQRDATVAALLSRLDAALPPGSVIRAAQLYHDREEITVVVLPAGVSARPAPAS